MLKRNNKSMAVIVALCLCLAMIAPIVVNPGVAEASATYRGMTVPTFGASDQNVDFGTIEIDVTSAADVASGDVLTISFPTGVKCSDAGSLAWAVRHGAILTTNTTAKTASPAHISVVVPDVHPQTGLANGFVPGFKAFFGANTGVMAKDSGDRVFVTGTQQSINITFGSNGFNRGILYVNLNEMDLDGASGELTCTLLGNGAAFPMGTVVVGKVSTTKGTAVSMKSVKAIGSAATSIDTFTMIETSKNSLTSGEVVKVKLPSGFQWSTTPAAVPASWAYLTSSFTAACSLTEDDRILNIRVGGNALRGLNTTEGRFDFVGSIKADDSVAKKGDVVAHISSDKGNVTEQDITLANYGEYGAKPEEGTVNKLYAGKAEQKLGTFYVTESLPGSLVSGRTIKLTLPEGMKWWAGYQTAVDAFPVVTAEQGAATIKPFTVAANNNNSSDDGRTITCTVNAQSNTKAGKLKFKDFKVEVSPEFVAGPVNLTVSGTAGCTGEVKVAEVSDSVTGSVDSVLKVRIGEQKQALGKLVIKEAAKEMIKYRSTAEYVNKDTTVPKQAATNARTITLVLGDDGAKWSSIPTVKVTEGDLQLNIEGISRNGKTLTIPVKSTGMTASTIEITDGLVTLDRTVPEGDLKVTIDGYAVNELPDVFPNADGPDFVIASCITPAPDEGTSGAATGEFKIGSNIYEVNGVAKVMDAAPYIKAGRTYMPIRFLGYAMGLTDDDIVWDEATQKVTMTKGEKVVELTVGSTTITVNGEAKTMDVAPEITGGRTMLPARYVAEGLGYVVGWDAGTQTVLISK